MEDERRKAIKNLETFIDTTGSTYGRNPMTRPSRPHRGFMETARGFWDDAKEIVRTKRDTASKRMTGFRKRQADRGAKRMKFLKEAREGQ